MAELIRRGVGEIVSGPSTTMVEWKIKDYFDYPQDVGYLLVSPIFSFLETDFCLYLYPAGKTSNQPKDSISIYLVRKRSSSPNLLVKFKIQIVQHDKSNLKDALAECTFENDNYGFGWPNFLEVSELNRKKNEIAPNGVLTVLCTISSNTPKSVHTAVQTQTPLRKDASTGTLEEDFQRLRLGINKEGFPFINLSGVNKLGKDLKELLESGMDSDVVIQVQYSQFQAHKAILKSRSSVLAAMFKHNMKEADSGVIDITDCDPGVFKQFLLYVYTGDVDCLLPDNVCEVYRVADKYDIQDLKTRCLEYIQKNLSVDSICDVISLALQHKERELLEDATQFFLKNAQTIFVTVKWLSFMKDNTVAANELTIKAFNFLAECKK